MTSIAPLIPRKTPRQSRATATRDAIVEAAARILEADGMGGFNTNAIAARAGVSIGSLYQYFPAKDAILAHERWLKSRFSDKEVETLIELLTRIHE